MFGNRLRSRRVLTKHPHASSLPELIVGVDVVPWYGGIEGRRPDNQDVVFYKPSELIPLTQAARDLLAIARGGK